MGSKSNLVKGDKLSPDLRAEVLRAYVHRWTIENKANVTRLAQMVGLDTPTLEPMSDAEWLRTHAFAVTKAGKLSRRDSYAHPAFMAD